MNSGDIHESIPDQPTTIEKGGGRKWIYPKEISGKWQNLRLVSSTILLIILYATPWIRIGGEPLLKLSFLSSSFVMFGSHILIYEFYHFVLLALLLVLTLFIASAVIGRVWCGFACPQTIFIEQILGRVDRFFEGPSTKRQVDSRKPWTTERIVRRAGKLLAYGVISFTFAFTLTALFTGPELLLSGQSSAANWTLIILTGLAWFDAAYWREQFCHIVCPYARFQGVMQDLATITIGYDHTRGEPRGRSNRASASETDKKAKLGDCIDCGLCVRVCPSGIDIRQGATQLECIACARCVDACDGVMENIGRPKGLIRYDSLAIFEENKSKPMRPKILRPRIAAYALVWLVLCGFGVHQFVHRSPFHARIFGTPGASPWFTDNNRIKNILSLKIGNQQSISDSFTVSISAEENNHDIKIETQTELGPIAPGQELTTPLLISILALKGPTPVIKERIIIRSQSTGKESIIERSFVGPKI